MESEEEIHDDIPSAPTHIPLPSSHPVPHPPTDTISIKSEEDEESKVRPPVVGAGIGGLKLSGDEVREEAVKDEEDGHEEEDSDELEQCAVCLDNINPKRDIPASSIITMPCKHQFHSHCLLEWLHYNHDLCPICKRTISMDQFSTRLWKIKNIAVPSEPSPEVLSLGLRATGWFNIQLQVVPPPVSSVLGAPVPSIKKIQWVFHPAFNKSRFSLTHPPFNLVLKLCSNHVRVVAAVELTNGEHMTFVHVLEKETCERVYIKGLFNGTQHPDATFEPVEYFKHLLPTYRRPTDYYAVSDEPPPRHRGRGPRDSGSGRSSHDDGRSSGGEGGNAVSRFFRRLWGGWR
ncbi:hypothetical protein ADUPG1_007068 [Aduncisulcus paluster]|uniref:RING-type E3 ubiquitin transferase n=1 Tax=Aduncisulcus paluster TaxID=2918883 RepID=A0ABQ5KKL0_9EUKA|nr:hypothetical protein ADUPG1_007068 [Aduncisulcus paluster]